MRFACCWAAWRPTVAHRQLQPAYIRGAQGASPIVGQTSVTQDQSSNVFSIRFGKSALDKVRCHCLVYLLRCASDGRRAAGVQGQEAQDVRSGLRR
jgi:hypothetical protein